MSHGRFLSCASHAVVLANLVLVLALGVAACSNEDEGATPFAASQRSRTSTQPPTEDVGTARRRAQGEHCCYEGQYHRCASPSACFGGVDLDECVANCNYDSRCITNVCTNKLRHAPPPAKSCTPAEVPSSFSCD